MAKIFEQNLTNKNGEKLGKIAIIMDGLNSENPTDVVNNQVAKYVGKTPHNQFVDIKLNNPWTRLIISGIDKLPFENYDTYLKKKERLEKLKRIENVKNLYNQ